MLQNSWFAPWSTSNTNHQTKNQSEERKVEISVQLLSTGVTAETLLQISYCCLHTNYTKTRDASESRCTLKNIRHAIWFYFSQFFCCHLYTTGSVPTNLGYNFQVQVQRWSGEPLGQGDSPDQFSLSLEIVCPQNRELGQDKNRFEESSVLFKTLFLRCY